MDRYNNLNGFRAFCAIGIALMHILANISPTPHLKIITPVIQWFTNFVFLFFIMITLLGNQKVCIVKMRMSY